MYSNESPNMQLMQREPVLYNKRENGITFSKLLHTTVPSTFYSDIIEYILNSPHNTVHYKCVDEYDDKNGDRVIVCGFAYPADIVKYLKYKASVDVAFITIKKLRINMPQDTVVNLIKSKRMELVIKNNSFVIERMNGACKQEHVIDFDVVNAIILMKRRDFVTLKEHFRPTAEVVSLIPHDNVFLPDYMKEYLVRNKHFDAFDKRILNAMNCIFTTKGRNDYVFVSNKENVFMYDRNAMHMNDKLPGGKIKYVVKDDKLGIENPLVAIDRELDEEWFSSSEKPVIKKDFVDVFIINNALVFFLYLEVVY